MPAQLDDAMRRRLVDEMFENWLGEQIQEMGGLQVVDNHKETGETEENQENSDDQNPSSPN
jgi:hypothetical protein